MRAKAQTACRVRAKDELGRFGEEEATRHLASVGLRILDRNWRCPAGELDIVAREGPALVFCEVKTRSSAAYGLPAEAVGPAKAARIRRLAARWIVAHDVHAADLRFDVVSVLRPPSGAAVVRHIRGAF